VAWDELALFLNRCTDGLSEEEHERIGELYPIENGAIHFLMRAALSPARLHRVAWLATRRAFPHLGIEFEEISKSHVVARLELPRRYRGCPFFFRGTVGECRTLTELLGVGPSEVTADVGGWHGYYDIRFAAGDGVLDDLRAASRRLVGDHRWAVSSLIGWLFSVEGEDAQLAARLERVHGLSPAEARIVIRLGHGVDLRDIAAELGWRRSDVEGHLRAEHARIGAALRAEVAARMLDSD
jgi:DNA-binding CsgD family transcriptional regulator